MKGMYFVTPPNGPPKQLTADELNDLLRNQHSGRFEVETRIPTRPQQRVWCAVYCAEEYCEEVEKVLRVVYQAIGTVHPEWEFDIDQDWERCHDELEQ